MFAAHAHLIAFVLQREGVPKADPRGREIGVRRRGPPKVAPGRLVLSRAHVVAAHGEPGQSALRVLLHQPAAEKIS